MSGEQTAVVGGRVLTMNPDEPEAEAVLFRDGRIVAVGDRPAVEAAAGAGEGAELRVIDVGGALVLPGFIDAHHHVSLSSVWAGTLRLSHVRDIPSLLAALAEAARKLPPDKWVVAFDWDEGELAERRPPTRQELDDAVGERPLFAMHYTGHRALANSRALELAGIDRHTPEPSGGAIERGPGGVPTGLLIERGMSPVEALSRAERLAEHFEGILESMAAHYRGLLEVGITGVADLTVPLDLLPVYREAARRGLVPIPTLCCPVSIRGYLEEPWDALDGPGQGHFEGPVSIGPVKLVFDGAPGCHMCLSWGQVLVVMARTVGLAIRQGNLDPLRTSMSVTPRYGRDVRSGIAIYRQEEADRMVRAVMDRGRSVATHAIGNEAIRIALEAYGGAGPSLHAAGVPRIEHGALLGGSLIARLADVGAHVVAQPGMLGMPSYSSAVSIPGMPFFPLRALLDAGVPVAGSSDYPVHVFDPLEGVRRAVGRRRSRGGVIDPEERIDVREALAMYTRGSAAACGWLDRAGTLEPGKRADLVILDGELGAPDTLRVRRTFVAGELLYEA